MAEQKNAAMLPPGSLPNPKKKNYLTLYLANFLALTIAAVRIAAGWGVEPGILSGAAADAGKDPVVLQAQEQRDEVVICSLNEDGQLIRCHFHIPEGRL